MDATGKRRHTPPTHLLQPDYTRPLFSLTKQSRERIMDKLIRLYGRDAAGSTFFEIERLMKVYHAHKHPQMLSIEKKFVISDRFTQQDAILITYGDMIRAGGVLPLQALSQFAERFLQNAFSTIHILPFFPYSSDRGFAVKDFKRVDANLGTWQDIRALKAEFKLMFDLVINHVSAKHPWFEEFLNGNPEFERFFIAFDHESAIPPEQLALIFRPRTSPLLSPFFTLNGPKSVWTTFSRDQIDLNFQNPKVLIKAIDILLTYVRQEANTIRLDAVTYLWKQLGTRCIHLEAAHLIIRLFRDILDAVAPQVAIITETNVPHAENILYFGDGRNEAQMVYNFALPPLVLHAFIRHNTGVLTRWAQSLEKVSDTATYFNFLDSHDGIGLPGARGILKGAQIERMIQTIAARGGRISYKDNGDGTVSAYEINSTWFSALNDPDGDEAIGVKRYLASRAIPLSLMGVPGIYLHGLLGTPNDVEAAEREEPRSINRKTLHAEKFCPELEEANSVSARIYYGMIEMLKKRRREKGFHPNAPQRVIAVSDALFCLTRTAVDGASRILCVINVTPSSVDFEITTDPHGLARGTWQDLLSGRKVKASAGKMAFQVLPYEVLWLKAVSGGD
jgi:glucosylglycerate phosphorylase